MRNSHRPCDSSFYRRQEFFGGGGERAASDEFHPVRRRPLQRRRPVCKPGPVDSNVVAVVAAALTNRV
jgi:hypothetical protein